MRLNYLLVSFWFHREPRAWLNQNEANKELSSAPRHATEIVASRADMSCLLVASQQFSRQSPIKRDLPPASKYNRKICSKMITSIIRYHKAIYYIMSITRDRFRPYWVSSGGCKKHSIINMLKKQICHWVQKNAIQNNMIQQYLYHGDYSQGHTHMTWTTSHIGKP